MSRPIEQALANLIPRHSGSLPSELIELAGSLLAQSRNKCSNLKAEEEVARTYACANLACERLKTTLNLPPIEPRPPIPPKVYSNLYSYFNRSLTTRKPSKPTPKNPTPSKSLPQRQTPQKENSFKSFQPAHRTAKPGLRYAAKADLDARIPAWLAPVTRLLCRELETPKAVPHILAGVETILCLPTPKDGEKRMEEKLPALVSAIWFFVVVKMRGKENQGKENLDRKKKVREVLNGAKDNEIVVAKIGEAGDAWKGWEIVEERDVNAWRKEIVSKEWKELDWFEGIEEGGGVGDENEVVEEDVEEVLVENMDGEDVGRKKGLGTMMLDKFDYLSEKNRREHAVWEKRIKEKIDELIAEGIMNNDTMDTTEG